MENTVLGVDVTKISRFEDIKKKGLLPRFIQRYNVDGSEPKDVAKTWAILEAITKAEGDIFDYSNVRVIFPKNKRPEIIDSDGVLSGKYVVSISHEDDLVFATAINTSILKR